MQVRIEVHRGPWAGMRPVEIVERKGLGHPDTICDMLSEQLSVALSRKYLDEFGLVLHHNVDKALLAAGRAEPAFGGGRILEPMDIYLAGRATSEVRGKPVPVRALAEETATAWLRANIHALAPERDVRIHCLLRPGSGDLVDLFMRQRDEGAYLANDTSCGAGFAPLTDLERAVLAVERSLNAPQFKAEFPETGEDIKVMGVREHDRIGLTISCAFIGRFLRDMTAYNEAKDRLLAATLESASNATALDVSVLVNAADDIANGSVYLTVVGTSAEGGDDGQTGRGNRVNGLITPGRPMTLEALAGKNPVTHVGKLYNAAASRLAAAIVAEVPGVMEAECYLVSEIGSRVDRPRMTYLRVGCHEGVLSADSEDAIRAIAEREIASVPLLWKAFLLQAMSVS
ncbi:MAG: methionine adenosyltransferase [Hyphomicrobium sp.]|uniref:methionine adenosyltransferase n=1 Tax=Hyphomicrobium sp. TaxID=82 RepID=UPI00132B4808|nr:methionine adenosyltransferase [Hyphomicrobium sp.]KAB2943098.1 MAG: methionine adenosyltransferase [Hyphomicrobium sp.]MBZ0208977.1 methionine adenosyltransferase [Hyphomicrobium sp.]MCZ7594227.1 methionine adenosyltransferase [Hyphomicrobium sp.]